jgi:hypothetical protein
MSTRRTRVGPRTSRPVERIVYRATNVQLNGWLARSAREQARKLDRQLRGWGDGALLAFLKSQGDYIRLLAFRQSFGNGSVIDDLEQEAWIVAWELEPTRFRMDNAADVRYVRKAFKNRMCRLRQRLRAQAGGWRDAGMHPLRMERLAEAAALAEPRYNHIEGDWAYDEATAKQIRALPHKRWTVHSDGTLERIA